ncbi:Sphingomyelin phosphodiesterase [Halotydeus destructor]|nr:Sphingomyelin phosphodiesterase [Halotydeus destructor]
MELTIKRLFFSVSLLLFLSCDVIKGQDGDVSQVDTSFPERIKILIAAIEKFGETEFKKVINTIYGGLSQLKETCLEIETLITLGKKVIRSDTEFEDVFYDVCSTYRIESSSVCKGLSKSFSPALFFIFKNSKLSSKEMAAILLGRKCMTKAEYERSRLNFSLTWPAINQSASASSSRTGRNGASPVTVQSGREAGIRKFLHLTDIHVDLDYQVGANVQCKEQVLCCRTGESVGSDGELAGYWGELRGNCDIPNRVAIESLEKIRTVLSHDPTSFEYVLWTGDMTPHNVWQTSRTSVHESARTWSRLVQGHLPANMSVILVLGNHEAHPVDMYSPPYITGDISTSWIYSDLYDLWQDWIPGDGKTFKYGGFYSHDLADKLRVIVLNTNLWTRTNFWSLYDPRDPYGQLDWLADQLAEAETLGLNVHIAGHHPVGHEWLDYVVHNYLQLIERYQDTVKATFHGHTHLDEVRLHYANCSAKVPLVVGFVGGSLTTYYNVNPNYKIYTIDETTSAVLDVDTYYFNMTAANVQGNQSQPVWLEEQSAIKAFNMADLSPQQWAQFMIDSQSDVRLMDTYYQRGHRYSGVEPWLDYCDDKCQISTRQSMIVTDPTLC